MRFFARHKMPTKPPRLSCSAPMPSRRTPAAKARHQAVAGVAGGVGVVGVVGVVGEARNGDLHLSDRRRTKRSYRIDDDRGAGSFNRAPRNRPSWSDTGS